MAENLGPQKRWDSVDKTSIAAKAQKKRGGKGIVGD